MILLDQVIDLLWALVEDFREAAEALVVEAWVDLQIRLGDLEETILSRCDWVSPDFANSRQLALRLAA